MKIKQEFKGKKLHKGSLKINVDEILPSDYEYYQTIFPEIFEEEEKIIKPDAVKRVSRRKSTRL